MLLSTDSQPTINTAVKNLIHFDDLPLQNHNKEHRKPNEIIGTLISLQGLSLLTTGEYVSNLTYSFKDPKLVVEFIVKGALVDIFRDLKIKPGKQKFSFNGNPTIGYGQIKFNTTITTKVKKCPDEKQNKMLKENIEKVIAKIADALNFDKSYKRKNVATISCDAKTKQLKINIDMNYDLRLIGV